jgi:hypothetical protein
MLAIREQKRWEATSAAKSAFMVCATRGHFLDYLCHFDLIRPGTHARTTRPNLEAMVRDLRIQIAVDADEERQYYVTHMRSRSAQAPAVAQESANGAAEEARFRRESSAMLEVMADEVRPVWTQFVRREQWTPEGILQSPRRVVQTQLARMVDTVATPIDPAALIVPPARLPRYEADGDWVLPFDGDGGEWGSAAKPAAVTVRGWRMLFSPQLDWRPSVHGRRPLRWTAASPNWLDRQAVVCELHLGKTVALRCLDEPRKLPATIILLVVQFAFSD